jgi:hypothetical protein
MTVQNPKHVESQGGEQYTVVSRPRTGTRAWPGYWCECIIHIPGADHGASQVGSFDTDSAGQALRWIRVSLRTLLSALTPDETEAALYWLLFGQDDALLRLRSGAPFLFSVSHGSARIEWIVRRVVFLPLAHRATGKLPTCAETYPGFG